MSLVVHSYLSLIQTTTFRLGLKFSVVKKTVGDSKVIDGVLSCVHVQFGSEDIDIIDKR